MSRERTFHKLNQSSIQSIASRIDTIPNDKLHVPTNISFQFWVAKAIQLFNLPFLEEVVAFVVNNDECWEILHLDFPNGLHA
jgi:hypothetical protein